MKTPRGNCRSKINLNNLSHDQIRKLCGHGWQLLKIQWRLLKIVMNLTRKIKYRRSGNFSLGWKFFEGGWTFWGHGRRWKRGQRIVTHVVNILFERVRVRNKLAVTIECLVLIWSQVNRAITAGRLTGNTRRNRLLKHWRASMIKKTVVMNCR